MLIYRRFRASRGSYLQRKIVVRCRLQASCLTICLVLAVLAFNMLLPRTSASGGVPQYIEEFAVPTANSAPLAVTVDERGIVWFTESNASKLGRFDPSSRIFQEYAVGGVGDMWGVTVDGRGYVWLTQYSGKGSVNPGGGNRSRRPRSACSSLYLCLPQLWACGFFGRVLLVLGNHTDGYVRSLYENAP